MTKIFCVGFQKTGTTTMAAALKVLGFSVAGASKLVNRKVDWKRPDLHQAIWEVVQEVVENNDAIQDSPCPFFYKDFDAAYPGARFILTERDPDKWLKSYSGFFPDENNRLRAWMYGTDRLSGNEAEHKRIYLEQNARIKQYFAGRDADFLIMNLESGDGWLKLVNFLSSELEGRFIHRNRGGRSGKNTGSGAERPKGKKRKAGKN